ncbi:autotransporter outer membrane beta-barrel domain-containing protein [Mesorhizobium sp. CA14]|uniref:autotransporter outer membrane beta-barrel domain-containing protein n=1 Tax=Mesorhizobium sp. CA14 TaxID=2876642 RepID=UPI001CD00DBA|nr:autotransporter outer membrane beta-barrel domain-containing protein [Mesorhizobium sp. CA14]MBZ9849786.1 autotransporter outer membrane beta-barrel domain-containing protein [Mesorhizobium sp. CA14]
MRQQFEQARTKTPLHRHARLVRGSASIAALAFALGIAAPMAHAQQITKAGGNATGGIAGGGGGSGGAVASAGGSAATTPGGSAQDGAAGTSATGGAGGQAGTPNDLAAGGGGGGGAGDGTNFGGNGGNGGGGNLLSTTGTFSLSGGYLGSSGSGGASGAGTGSVGGGGRTGAGGAGVFLYAGGTLAVQAGTIMGGDGLDAGSIAGDAGAGVLSNLGTISNQGTIAGGAGGDGFGGAFGGDGGAGLVAWGGSIDNAATGVIAGGNGGNNRTSIFGRTAGDGGAGVQFLNGQTGSLFNAGTIQGGTRGESPEVPALGHAGVGVMGAASGSIAIVNSGTITGGTGVTGGGPAVLANAISLFGSNNRLELRAGSTITGNVVVAPGGGNNALVLGGTTDANFDVSQIGDTQQYRGFDTFEKTNTSLWILTGAGNQNWSITGGALQGDTSSIAGNVTFVSSPANRAVVFDQAFDGVYAGTMSGDGALFKDGAGTATLTGANTYTGGTTIMDGTLQIGDGGTAGSIAGNIVNNGTLSFNRSDAYTFAGEISGSGIIRQLGDGRTTLTGNSAGFTGATTIAAGTLAVNGSLIGSAVTVQSGATLGGSGTVGGTNVETGGRLAPGNSIGILTIAGNLTLAPGANLDFELGSPGASSAAPGVSDRVVVSGDLALTGTVNLLQSSAPADGDAGLGYYRLITYGGALTSNTAAIGSTPALSGGQYELQAGSGRVDLFIDTSLGDDTLQHWQGGDGTWKAGNPQWLNQGGAEPVAWAGKHAIFKDAGVYAGGTVTVEGAQSFKGIQFVDEGYRLQGAGQLVTDAAGSEIRVLANSAEIANAITGTGALIKTEAGTLVLTGDNTYTGGTRIDQGTLQVSADANLGDASGKVTLDGGALATTASFSMARAFEISSTGTLLPGEGTRLTITGVISGAGNLLVKGGGTTVVTADSSAFTGTTSIDKGTLAVNGGLCGDVNVLDGGRLQGTGTVCHTNNFDGGTVAPGNSIGTLTVAGDYVGSGGTLDIETELGGDASPTDRLVVTGNASGTTRVKVTNVGGAGAQTVEGIRIIDVGGSSDGTFSLLGDYVFQDQQAVVGGAYAYLLQKNGVNTPADGDWYLRSTFLNPENPEDPDPQPLYAPGAPLYEAYAGVLQSFNELGTLQQRVGNRSWGEGATPQGADVPGAAPLDGRAIWARLEAAHAEFDPETSTSGTAYDVTTWKMQAGVDGLLGESAAGQLLGGATVHYGQASSDVSSAFGTGSIDATGYGPGGTLTWLGNSGFYVDAQAEATWYDSDLKSATLATTLADGNEGFGYGLSIEAGRKVALNNNWSLTPQAQLTYSSVDFDDFADPFGAVVSLGSGDTLVGRLGLSADYEDQWVDRAGQVSRAHVYSIANLHYDILDGSKVNVSGIDFVSENQALWGGLGAGGSLSWADDRYAIFGEAIARASLEDFGDSYAIGGKVGFSVKW